jgi:Ca-activated chloride channel family protein
MKKNSEQFESNISRLVKLAGDSERPSEPFTEKLIGEVLGSEKSGQLPPEMERKYPMKRNWTYRITAAACVLVMVGLMVAIMPPALQKATKVSAYKHSYPKLSTDRMAVSTEVPQTTRYQGQVYQKGVPEAETIDGSTNVVTNNYKSSPTGPGSAHGGTTPPNNEPFDAMFFKNYGVNPFVDTDDDRFSTFATDVDTGSYTLCRSYLDRGELPPRDAVRVEEFVNYFKYNYPAPRNDVFAVYADAAPWKFAPDRPNSYLMRIGLKAFELSDADRKPAVLTFVIDVSGSMATENRLELVKQSLRLLVDHLQPDDRIGIAVYGSNGRKVLDHTGLSNKGRILNAIKALSTNGSTNAEQGIRIGYEMASQAFRPGWINRVILCSDGVANVGQTGPDEIFKLIKNRVDEGITLSAMGFGMGNYNDVLMEQLGDKGNGHYAYIDTLDEARRIFCGNLTQVLQVAARDVKLQVEFNPGAVRSYRLIGYENRDVPDAKFRDDKQDGGEVGPGHRVTAMYELKLWNNEPAGNLATVFVRYKDAETLAPTEFNCAIGPDRIHPVIEETSNDFLLAATVTEFAEILRQSYWARGATLDDVGRKTAILRSRMPGNDDIVQLDMLVGNSRNLMNLKKDTAEPDSGQHDHPVLLNGNGGIR